MNTGPVNVSPPANHKKRTNALFPDDEEISIFLEHGGFRSVIQVRWSFRRYEMLSANFPPQSHLTFKRHIDMLRD